MNEIIHVPKRIDLLAMLPKGSVVVEVGVWRGYFSTEMLELPNIGHLYLVDAWRNQPGYKDPLSDTDHESNLAETRHNIRGHMPGGRVSIIRADSIEAAMVFHRDGKLLDCAYIDAAHDFNSVYADLKAWSMAVKPDGFLMGHDFTRNPMAQKYGWGVIEAVEAFCKEQGWRITHLTDEDFASFCLRKI